MPIDLVFASNAHLGATHACSRRMLLKTVVSALRSESFDEEAKEHDFCHYSVPVHAEVAPAG